MTPIKIYLAGPDVFFPCDLETGQKKIDFCKDVGAEGIYPSFLLPKDLFTGNFSKEEKRIIINHQCKSGIRDADIVILNLTPFRGIEMDSGTAFEAGFADALGKTIFGYSNIPETYLQRMLKVEGTHKDSSNTWRDKNNCVIEDFDLSENCMIGSSCIDIFVPSNKEQEKLKEDPLYMFKKCIQEAIAKHDLLMQSEIDNANTIMQILNKQDVTESSSLKRASKM